MNIQFLRREYKNKEIDNNILTPLYLLLVKKDHPELWHQFIGMINMINNGRFEKYLEKMNSKKPIIGGSNE